MSERLPSLSPVQLDPRKLPADDFWTWTCGICFLCVQGGRAGLRAHMLTVHPTP